MCVCERVRFACACVHACICACLLERACVSACVPERACVRACMRAWLSVHAQVCACVSVTCACVHVCLSTHACGHACMRVEQVQVGGGRAVADKGMLTLSILALYCRWCMQQLNVRTPGCDSISAAHRQCCWCRCTHTWPTSCAWYAEHECSAWRLLLVRVASQQAAHGSGVGLVSRQTRSELPRGTQSAGSWGRHNCGAGHVTHTGAGVKCGPDNAVSQQFNHYFCSAAAAAGCAALLPACARPCEQGCVACAQLLPSAASPGWRQGKRLSSGSGVACGEREWLLLHRAAAWRSPDPHAARRGVVEVVLLCCEQNGGASPPPVMAGGCARPLCDWGAA